jgi:hypothetical protein
MSIPIDPSSLQCLNFTREIYLQARTNLINDEIDDVAATQKLAEMWIAINLTEQACYQLQQQG